jgi:hypothetical protein
MKKGYSYSQGLFQWIPAGEKLPLFKWQLAKMGIPLGRGSFVKGWHADAWLCETCQTVTIPLNPETE